QIARFTTARTLMRKHCMLLLLLGAGGLVTVGTTVRAQEQLPPPAVTEQEAPCTPAGTLNLPSLWELALAQNPALREAEAGIGEARGGLTRAQKYPNRKFASPEETLGPSGGPAGMVKSELNQEIVTAGKRRLDMAIARRGMDEATLALVGRRFDVLTRVRRA